MPNADKRFFVTMSKGTYTAYLHIWEDGVTDENGVLGARWGFSSNRDRALSLDGSRAVTVVRLLRESQADSAIKYSTTSAGA